MFPTSGYFRGVVCPFYVSGLCERPYCHFRHTKQDCEKSKDDLPSYSTASVRSNSPVGGTLSSSSSFSSFPIISTEDSYITADHDPTETFSSSAPKSANELLLANTTASFAIPSFTDGASKYSLPTAIETGETEAYKTADSEENWLCSHEAKKPVKQEAKADTLPVYYPTPKTPSLPTSFPASVSPSVPEYQPTPKRELKKRKASLQVGTDLEYDPESNYSCGGLGATNKPDEYFPEIKKAKIVENKAETVNSMYSRSSSESLTGQDFAVRLNTGCSTDVDMLNCDEEEDGPVDAKFSDDEAEAEPPQNFEAATEKDNDSDSLGSLVDICDDDISSDGDVVEVPDVPVPLATDRKMVSVSQNAGKKRESNLLKRDARKHRSRSLTVIADTTKSKVMISSKDKISSGKNSTKSLPGNEKLKASPNEISSHINTHLMYSSKLNSEKVDSKSSHKVQSKTVSKSGSGKSDKSRLSRHSDSDLSVSSKRRSESLKKTCEDADTSRKTSSGQSLDLEKPIDSKSSRNKSLNSNKGSGGFSSRHGVSLSKSCEQSLGVEKPIDSKSSKDKLQKSNKESDSFSSRHGVSLSKSYTHISSKDGQSLQNKHLASAKKFRKNNVGGSAANCKAHLSKSAPEDVNKTLSLSAKREHGNKSRRDSIESKSSKSEGHFKSHSNSSLKSSSSQMTSNKHKPGSRSAASVEVKVKKSGTGKDASVNLAEIKSDLFGDDSDDMESPADKTEKARVTLPDKAKVTLPDKTDVDSDVDYSAFIHDSDLEEEDTFDECLRIFRESSAQVSHGEPREKKLAKDLKTPKVEPVPTTYVGKKRIAHEAADKVKKPALLQKLQPRYHPSPAEVMHNRIMEMQKRALAKAAQAVQEQEVSSTSGLSKPAESSQDVLNREKKRIAHTPKPPAAGATSLASSGSPSKKAENPVSTASKTEKRVAHTPNVTNLKRPMIPASFGSKVPSNIRQRYLNLIIDECLKFCSSEEEAYNKGLEEEAGVYERSNNKNIYLRVAVNTISRLRTEAKEVLPRASVTEQRRPSLTQSHAATLGGSRAAKTSFSIKKPSSSVRAADAQLTVQDFHSRLQKYLLTEEQLRENGFPRSSMERKGEAAFFGTRYHQEDVLLKDNERNCARCGKRFIINLKGFVVTQEECVYHWTRAYMRRRNGYLQLVYNCCESDAGSKGCQVASSHVHDRNKYQNLTGFVTTLPSTSHERNIGVYALDCEMVYTVEGLELARVTVINMDGKVVFESLVQPSSPILDYNTRFSGLTAGDLQNVTTTLRDVQAILLNMFSDKTILIGHSLESDFVALKLIHSSVVDTSIVFPHRRGPPYKRALKNLMVEIFTKIIQSDDGGHDSKEDAQACMDLMKWRIKEDTKKEHRYIT